MRNLFLFSFLMISLLTSCSSGKQSDESDESDESLPYIDVTKNYSEKEIILTDIADITYVHLSTKNKDFIYKGRIDYVTENTIVACDAISGSVLLFSKNGTPKSRFNRHGKGPQEYMFMGMAQFKSINQLLYDEKTNEVFVYMGNQSNNILQVYSSKGKYLRTIKLPLINTKCFINIFDSQSFIINGENTFCLISRTNGEVLDFIDVPNGDASLIVTEVTHDGLTLNSRMECARMVNGAHGYYLCNPESDTIFRYNKDKSLTPVLRKTPLVNSLNPKIALDNCLDVGKYQFMRVHTRHATHHLIGYPGYPDTPKYPDKYYVREKKTGEIFRQKITLPDYKGKEFSIAPIPNHFFYEKHNRIHFELNLFELKEAYRENKLSGKLKKLVASLNENEDNNVFMFVDFK